MCKMELLINSKLQRLHLGLKLNRVSKMGPTLHATALDSAAVCGGIEDADVLRAKFFNKLATGMDAI